jgi:hypothetical protein
MGLPTLAMGVLGALLSPLTAASLLIVPSMVTNLWQLLAGPRIRVLARRLWPMMAASMVGTLAAAPLLTGGNGGATTTVLGATLRQLICRQRHGCHSTCLPASSATPSSASMS